MNVYKQIYKKIKKANKIVIARHIGPDPDALGSSLGLKELIKTKYPNKEVYVVGSPAKKFDYLGKIDKYDETMNDALLIVTDTPDAPRVDIPDIKVFKEIIKIDHHPFVMKYANIEWIDEKASSACEMIISLAFNTKFEITKEAAFKLYTGLIADTERFLFNNSSYKTFNIVSKLLEKTNIDITKIYSKLYARDYKEIKLLGYLYQNIKITENKVGYIVITDEILEEYKVDAPTPGNMINNFNHINELLVWTTLTYDKDIECYRVSIRSRGPIINEVAKKYGGGGHALASGTRIKDPAIIERFIKDLDKVASNYK